MSKIKAKAYELAGDSVLCPETQDGTHYLLEKEGWSLDDIAEVHSEMRKIGKRLRKKGAER